MKMNERDENSDELDKMNNETIPDEPDKMTKENADELDKMTEVNSIIFQGTELWLFSIKISAWS